MLELTAVLNSPQFKQSNSKVVASETTGTKIYAPRNASLALSESPYKFREDSDDMIRQPASPCEEKRPLQVMSTFCPLNFAKERAAIKIQRSFRYYLQ